MKPTLADADYALAAATLKVPVAAVRAVTEVESPKGGFCPDDFPTTLFEGHIFSRLTDGVYDRGYPTLSYAKWTRQFYGKTWSEERARLELASSLNRPAALQSASWGRFQIMGENWKVCGCSSLQDFINRMCASEAKQLALFVAFVQAKKLDIALRNKDWYAFARGYNGTGQVQSYGDRIAAAYKKFGGM